MKVTVDLDACIGCGLCAETCAAVYQMEDDKVKIIADPVPADQEEAAKKGADDCPVEAIKVS